MSAPVPVLDRAPQAVAGQRWRALRIRADDVLARPVQGVLVRTALLVGVAWVLELVLLRSTRLPEAAYDGGFLGFAVLRRLAGAGAAGFLVLGLAGVATGVALRKRSLGPAWRDFEHAQRLRLLIVLMAALLAWSYVSYDYNFYFDRWHAWDRLLLVAAVPLIAWRPVFTIPFLVLLLPVIWQFAHPIGGFSWAVPILPVRVIIIGAALWAIRLLTARIRTADFVFVLCCAIAAGYWASGWTKLQLGWLATDRVGFLLPSTYANGWLGFLAPDTIAAATAAVLALNGPARILTLAVECGAVLILWRRATVLAVLVGAVMMHTGILLLTGIGFWQWSVLDLLVVALFFVGRRRPDLGLFTPLRFALSIVLIAAGTFWFRPVRLAWLDARATYTYRLAATDSDGRTHPLPPAFFEPYDYQFTLGGFRYLVDDVRLPIAWGATTRAVAEALNEARTAADVLTLEAAAGRNDHDAARAADFERFVGRFVETWQRREGRGRWPAPLAAPATLWTFPRSDPVLDGARIVSVTVTEVLSFFDDERYVEIRRTPVRTIAIAR